MGGYATALGWLDRRGVLNEKVSPAARWGPQQVRDYVADLTASLRPATVRHRIVHLERALAVIEPEADRSLLRRVVARLPCGSDRSRKRKRLKEPARLFELGRDLMRKADAGWHTSIRKNATVYRVGLQVALLAMRPLRTRNFSAIRIGRHLVREVGGWNLRFTGAETKNGRPIEVTVPSEICEYLERYLSLYRPLLAAGRYDGDRLWVGYRFCAQSAHTLQVSIARVTLAEFGAPINPHLFRDCAATSIAIHDPQSVRIAATILGHASFGTTEKYYNLASSIEAGRAYSSVLDAHRAGKRSRSKTSKRG